MAKQDAIFDGFLAYKEALTRGQVGVCRLEILPAEQTGLESPLQILEIGLPADELKTYLVARAVEEQNGTVMRSVSLGLIVAGFFS